MIHSPHPAAMLLSLFVAGFLPASSLVAASPSAHLIDRMRLTDLNAWRSPTGDWATAGGVNTNGNVKKLALEPGKGVLVNGAQGRTVNLLSAVEHGDVAAHIEFVVPKDSNSGVYFQGRYEIQVFDSWGVKDLHHGDCGGIYERWKNDKGYEGHAPKVNASRPPGTWQSLDVEFRAPRFDASGKKIANAKFIKVVLNGKVLHENVEVTGPTRAAYDEQTEVPFGPLMLQGDHGPVAYRKLQLRPLR